MNKIRPNSLAHMKQIDGLRFIAVGFVMLGHFIEGTTYDQYFGYLANFGVTLFFVLSGFLISQILITNKNEGHTLRQFYIRRFLRIFPLYYLVLFLALALNIPECRHYFPWLVTYTANIPAGLTQGHLGYLTHLWSLSVEEQFYIFFPFLILLIPDRHHLNMFKVLVFLSIVSRIILYIMYRHSPIAGWVTYMFTPCCFDSFGIGAILAYYRLNRPERLVTILNRNYLFVICGILCISVPFISIKPIFVAAFFRTTFSLFCFWVIGKASLDMITGLMGSFLNNKIVIYLGKISYGIYVYHHFMPYIFSHFNIPYAHLYYAPLTIVISAISWHFYELPINNLKKYFNYKTPRTTSSVHPVA
jgi:peptidoglycan/LPS O-acetylase OafA/YrhL